MSRPTLLFVLVFAVLIGAATTVGAETRPGDGAMRAALSDALVAWDGMTPQERGPMARLLAFSGATEALPTLRGCAAAGGPEAADCLLAMAILDDLDGVVTVRERLRRDRGEQVVATAALALARWRDRLSYSLINKALLEGRGGALGQVALLRAMLAMPRGPWRAVYLEFHRNHAPASAARMAAAARLAEAGQATAPALEQLRAGVEGWLNGRGEALEARQAAWGLSRARGKGCGPIQKIVAPHLTQAGAKRVEALLGDIHPNCTRGWRRQLDALGVDLPAVRQPLYLDGKDMPLPVPMPVSCAQARSWLVRVTSRRELWPAAGPPPALDHLVVERLCDPKVEALGWEPTTLAWIKPAATVKLTGPPADAATRVIDEPPGLYPEPFNKFTPPLEQPDWWPEHIYVTIDDGPRPGLHGSLNKLSKQYGVKFTYFMVGANIMAAANDDFDRARRVLLGVLDNGHHLAYHSMNHVTRRKEHLINFTDAQLKDDVDLYRLVVKMVAGKEASIIYGRMPGGLGSYRAGSRKSYHHAGLNAPVFWNAGPPQWMPRESLAKVRAMACAYKKETRQVTLLLHETANLENELKTFFEVLKGSACR